MKFKITASSIAAGLLVALAALPVAAHAAAKAKPKAIAVAAKSAAPAAKSLGKFGAWEGFELPSKTGNVCYAATAPSKSENAPKTRGRADVAITDRPADKSVEVISFTPGYTFKNGAPATVTVGTAKFDLYVNGNLAWSTDDKSVVAAMKKGANMVFTGTSDHNAQIADTYPLNGLSQALTAVAKACAAK